VSRDVLSDEDLMQAYADDDLEAFEALYRRHRGRLFGFLVGRLKNRSEAEEVFQTVFAKLHQGRRSYRREVPFLPWFFTIARNALIDHLRRQQRQPQVILSEEAVAVCAAPARSDVPIGAAIAELSSLSAAQRQALELRFNQGLSFQEIAEELELSTSNARQIVSRAVARLRRLMIGKEAHHERS
jgi:RNA polymerase sigma-70 factor (ECF subfamily)